MHLIPSPSTTNYVLTNFKSCDNFSKICPYSWEQWFAESRIMTTWWHWSSLDWTRLSHSRRAQLSWLSGSSGAVFCVKHLAWTICCQTHATRQWQTVYTMPRHLNCSQPEQINFLILFSPITCYITISLGPVLYLLVVPIVPVEPLARIWNKLFVRFR